LTLTITLAVLAAVPVLQFLSLGYLLESAGRIARTGRLRDGFIGVRTAARFGGAVLGVWLSLLPVWLVSSLALEARLIPPGRPRRPPLASGPGAPGGADDGPHRARPVPRRPAAPLPVPVHDAVLAAQATLEGRPLRRGPRRPVELRLLAAAALLLLAGAA